MKVTYYAGISLDGYIAKPDGDVSWIDELNIPPEKSGYNEFYNTVDGLVMGRATYDFVHSYGTWPYGSKPTWVCTSSKFAKLEGVNLQVDSAPVEVVQSAKSKGVTHLWLVGGGKLASAFLEQSLLTDISITQMPIILGSGISLFAELTTYKLVKLVNCSHSEAGFTQLEYQIK
jgi:dihydrofolate reductase